MMRRGFPHVILIQEIYDIPYRSTLGGKIKVDHAFIGTRLEVLGICLSPSRSPLAVFLKPFHSVGRDSRPTLAQCDLRAVPSGVRGPMIREELTIGISMPLESFSFHSRVLIGGPGVGYRSGRPRQRARGASLHRKKLCCFFFSAPQMYCRSKVCTSKCLGRS